MFHKGTSHPSELVYSILPVILLPRAYLGHTSTRFKITRMSCFQYVGCRKLSLIKLNSIIFSPSLQVFFLSVVRSLSRKITKWCKWGWKLYTFRKDIKDSRSHQDQNIPREINNGLEIGPFFFFSETSKVLRWNIFFGINLRIVL